MAYTPPVFNVLADVWFAGHTPADHPPDEENQVCQLYVISRPSIDVQPDAIELWTPPILIRLPVGSGAAWEAGQIWEVQAESGFYYRSRWKERVHFGFPNAYYVVLVDQCDSHGCPILRDVVPPICPETETITGVGNALLEIEIVPEGIGHVVGGGGGEIHGDGFGTLHLQIDPLGAGENIGSEHSGDGSGLALLEVIPDGSGTLVP